MIPLDSIRSFFPPAATLKAALAAKADAVDLALKRRDVEHLLFRRDDADRIERFRDFVASLPDE